MSSSATLESCLVIKCEFVSPFSYCNPSINSAVVSDNSVVSIITTPVSSTDLKAFAIVVPSFISLLVDILATWSIISPVTSTEAFSKCCTTFCTALSIPSFNPLAPNSFNLGYASFKIECASTVAVVVPSPASLTVFLAASFKSVAPIFSIGSNNTIESATVTPSFVITGFPAPSSNITRLPLAPRVELTAFVSLFIPSNSLSLAS